MNARQNGLESALAHGVAIFEDRLIIKSRPPITEAEIAQVERRVGRPIPPGLLALWRTAFGGRIGYALDVDFGGHVAHFSFAELFCPGSDGYRDLWGWIDNEFECASETDDALAAEGLLRFLPFGGFEYLDRLYVCLEDGPDLGAVFAWMQGLPPAWALRLHQDSIARIADDVPALFRMLALEKDPFLTGQNDYSAGTETAEAVDVIRESDPALAEALTAKAREALLDWRSALEAGTLASDTRLRHLALHQAAMDGDVGLADRLASQGCDLDERYGGGGNLLDHMLVLGHDTPAAAMIDRGVDPHNAIVASAGAASAESVARLIALGARVSDVAASSAALAGRVDSARLIVDALLTAGGREMLSAMPAKLDRLANDAEASARRIELGKLGSNRTPAQYRADAAHLRTLRGHVETLLARRSKR